MIRSTVSRLSSRFAALQSRPFNPTLHSSSSAGKSSQHNCSAHAALASAACALVTLTAAAMHTAAVDCEADNKKPSQTFQSKTTLQTQQSFVDAVTHWKSSFIGEPTAIPSDEFIKSSSLSTLSELFSPTSSERSVQTLFQSYPIYNTAADLPLMFTQGQNDLHQRLERFLRNTQNIICQHICNIEAAEKQRQSSNNNNITLSADVVALQQSLQQGWPGLFREDVTIRPDGSGGGIARVLQHGHVFEKAGCSTSFAQMRIPFSALKQMINDHSELAALVEENEKAREFKDNDLVERFTGSISLVFHPLNPNVPTVHTNYRFFEFKLPNGRQVWWFGGGSDLTPMVVNYEDGSHFHRILKSVCDRYDSAYYPEFKLWADRYFYSPIRQECRGIGGIFFEDLHSKPLEHYESFVKDCAHHFSAAYFPTVLKHMHEPYTASDVHWQMLRRGRYTEFNLVYDQGTKYGLLQPNARVEAILMSLPYKCGYSYKYEPVKGSKLAETEEILKQPIQWI